MYRYTNLSTVVLKVYRRNILGILSSQVSGVRPGQSIRGTDNGFIITTDTGDFAYRRSFTRSFEPEPDPAPVPENLDGYVVLHDEDSPLWGFKPREVAPDPEVNRIGQFDYPASHVKTILNRERQFFWAEIVALHKYGRNLANLTNGEYDYVGKKMNVLMGDAVALTNRKEPLAVNYITGEFPDYEPARMAALICGGNTIAGTYAGENKFGKSMLAVSSFVAGEPLPTPTYEILKDPRVLWLTAVFKRGEVYPFSTLGDGIGVPYPLFTAQQYYFPMEGVRKVSERQPLYLRGGVASYR